MKQRFLNQKLGKRTSRRGELQKAKASLAGSKGPSRELEWKPRRKSGKLPQGTAPAKKAG